jgi:hypothetical protein
MPATEHECLWELWFALLPRGAWELLERLDESERAALEEWVRSVRDPTRAPPPEPVQKTLQKLQQWLDAEC